METPCPADAPNAGKPCDAPVSAHGTEPMPRSDGPGPTLSDVLTALLSVAQAINEQTEAIHALAASNERMADEMMAAFPDDQQGDDAPGVDLSGNPVKVS